MLKKFKSGKIEHSCSLFGLSNIISNNVLSCCSSVFSVGIFSWLLRVFSLMAVLPEAFVFFPEDREAAPKYSPIVPFGGVFRLWRYK
ncbi:hypothetical protein SAMN05444285_11813 [Draconibacterium orientale]|uniref:Uncharacterized protein n=1 Tax=Draconibacterium orientale TaxID=1168034 RepID=A0A1I0FU92_9BACT|nr:hypothetical protein SAMN05444285_11813 [Draconibacterium orientale]